MELEEPDGWIRIPLGSSSTCGSHSTRQTLPPAMAASTSTGNVLLRAHAPWSPSSCAKPICKPSRHLRHPPHPSRRGYLRTYFIQLAILSCHQNGRDTVMTLPPSPAA